MARTAPAPETVTLADAMARLAVNSRHILTLALDGRLEPTLSGDLTAASVDRVAAQRARALEDS